LPLAHPWTPNLICDLTRVPLVVTVLEILDAQKPLYPYAAPGAHFCAAEAGGL
jgi:hypothetical protein